MGGWGLGLGWIAGSSASLPGAQLIAYYLREPSREQSAPGRNYAEDAPNFFLWKNRAFFCDLF